MKAVSIREAQGQLGELIAQACRGETIVLTDGNNEVTLAPRVLDLEEDSPELKAELLKAANGPHSPLHEGELREIADRVLRERRAKRQTRNCRCNALMNSTPTSTTSIAGIWRRQAKNWRGVW